MVGDPEFTPELTIVGSKITGYLLNLDHRVGRHKAAWFIARGLRAEFDPPLLAALFRHGRPAHLVRAYDTEHGRRYIYEGPLECWTGRSRHYARSGRRLLRMSGALSLRRTRSESLIY